jgi:hypothetical protein
LVSLVELPPNPGITYYFYCCIGNQSNGRRWA